ncbi:ABC transporter substrate-binding protein [Bradyrhizobium sp. 2TAF24]|uniref:ABC transporter substrate-binding protein n=1 Tax=Bradyrhizobium sp. 2TAF24 TaxID=3233011 RepID=UPI003F905466
MSPRALSRRAVLAGGVAAAALGSRRAFADKSYDPGASDSEIRIGHINPYSGPASAYGVIGKVEAAYFRMLNERGGINGRHINFITYDDALSPPKTVEQTRRLIEGDEVLLLFNTLGTSNNIAIQKYMNTKKVPQLFVGGAASRFGADPAGSPWTMSWGPNYDIEGRIYARYILDTHPDARIGVFSQNDDYGRDIVKGFKEGLGDRAKAMIVIEETYEITEPTIETHIVKIKAAGADVFVDFSTSKFAAQAIKKSAELGWKPLHILNNLSSSIAATLVPAGIDNATGIVTTAYLKDVGDTAWRDDPGMVEFLAFLDKYIPDTDRNSIFLPYAYSVAQTLVHVLTQCGDRLTRDNVMHQAASLAGVRLPLLLPGITLTTSATDYYPIEQMQLARFNGAGWERFGSVISGK